MKSMISMSTLKVCLVASIVLASLSSCKYSDVSTTYMSNSNLSADNAAKGRALLEESVRAMRYDRFGTMTSYQTDVVFDWRFPWTLMPMNPFPGAKNKKTRFRFLPDSFDGQVEHLEGRNKGDVYGLQSWQYYSQENGQYEKDRSPRRAWGTATYHYLIEGPFRLLKADIIQYAGKAEYNGVNYDLVFATWDNMEPHGAHDQWLFYIHPDTKMVDLVNATIRDYFLPMPKNMAEGTVIYKRKKHESGVYFPEEMTIQIATPKKEKRHLYKMLMTNYRIDAFSTGEIKPFSGLKDYGDSKPIATK